MRSACVWICRGNSRVPIVSVCVLKVVVGAAGLAIVGAVS